MKQITFSIPDEKLDITLKHLSKLSFIRVTGESDTELVLDKKQQLMLSLMLKGYSLKDVATRCKLNYSTVRLRRHNIFELVNPNHPDDLVKYIISHDLLGLKFAAKIRGHYTRLQDKEKKFLLELLKGISLVTIGKKLNISDVASYRKDLLEKIRSGNPTGTIRYIIKQNLAGKAADTDRKNKAGLSDREKEVLMLLLKGNSNAEIAVALKLSKRTVEVHRSSILAKTNTKKSIDLMGYAVKNKLYKL